MTPEFLEFMRNLYGASGGAVPGPAWTAAFATLLWMSAYDDALAAGEHVRSHGGDAELVEEAFKDTFAERLGWTDAQFEEFWNDPANDFTPDGARRFKDSYDMWEWMTRNRR